VAAVTTTTICSLFAPMVSAASSMLVYIACIRWSVSHPCPDRKGGKVGHLHVGAPRSFCLDPDRGRDLPVADFGGLPMPSVDFDLARSYGDDGCD
jgi:hypothetical protein